MKTHLAASAAEAGIGPHPKDRIEAVFPAVREGQVTVVFTTHRPETVDWSRRLMELHDVVVLEEPPSPGFLGMLRGEVAIGDYLLHGDYEYPEFMKQSCRLLRDLHARGKKLFQIEPFLEILGGIHDHFADGGTGDDFPPGSARARVLEAERRATGPLLDYYRAAVNAPFDSVVEAVKRFAREDAARIRLRDRMRAEAVQGIAAEGVPSVESIFVEAGYIHYPLLPELIRRIRPARAVKPAFLLEPVARRLTGRRQILGPGDRLTLLYAFHPAWSGPEANILAAQSLIYIRILQKDENVAGDRAFPHSRDEAETHWLTRLLSYEDCRHLFSALRFAHTREARQIVRQYLDQGKRTCMET